MRSVNRAPFALLILLAACGQSATNDASPPEVATSAQASVPACIGGCEEPQDWQHCVDYHCPSLGLAFFDYAPGQLAGTSCSGNPTSCPSNRPGVCLCCPAGTCPSFGADPTCVACPDGQVCNPQSLTCGCPAGSELCQGECVDSGSNHACDDCGGSCEGGLVCEEGECVCPNGGEQCDGACIDPSSDPAHCGGCGQACDSDEVCSAGQCTCGGNFPRLCGSDCVNTQIDADHCGGCFKSCGAGGVCDAGRCLGSVPAH